MKTPVSSLFLIFGCVCFIVSGYLIWLRFSPTNLSFNTDTFATKSIHTIGSPTPVILGIADLGIKVPIVPELMENGKWVATTKGASYLVNTPIPGESGNSILYGHNWSNLLGRLPLAKPGQEITIQFDDGTVKTFVIAFTTIVTPAQTHILNQTKDARLTLYTCTGFLDSKRFVVTAIPV